MKTNPNFYRADISRPTVQLLLSELSEVADDWFILGVALGVHVRKLREIKASNNQEGVKHWMIDMFQSWLDSNPTASWEDVLRALEQLGHLTLASRLKPKYSTQEIEQQRPAVDGVYILMSFLACIIIIILSVLLHVHVPMMELGGSLTSLHVPITYRE